MAFLDTTAVNVALPAIGRDLGAGFSAFQWIINGYLLTLSALVLIGGSLGDLYGRRRIFLLGNILFAGASLLCGLAPGAGTLLACRFLQGAGAALLIPTSLALLRDCFAEEEQGRAVGLWSGWTGVAALVGPLLGGWFADELSWRLVFFINPVLALAVVLIARRHVPDRREPEPGRPDWSGGIAIALALGGLSYALIQGPESGWARPAIAMAFLLGILSLVLFTVVERRSAHPMIPPDFLRRRRFVAVNGATLFIYFTLSGVFFLQVILLQKVHGFSALLAGFSLAPITLLLLVMSPAAGRFAAKHGPRLPMIAGPLVAAAGSALLARIAEYRSFAADVLPGVMVFGAGLGITVAPLTHTALSALGDRHSGLASGVNNMVARLAQMLAIPMLPLAAGIASGSGPGDSSGAAFAEGFRRAAWIGAALLAVAAIIAAIAIKDRDGDGEGNGNGDRNGNSGKPEGPAINP
jgi:EmrB/QacA subfamily drug resistance transporter